MTRHFYESEDLLGDMLSENYFDHTRIAMRTGDILTVYSSTQNEYMDLRVEVDELANPDIAKVTPMDATGRGNLIVALGSSILAHGEIDTLARFGHDVVGPVEWAMRRLGWRAPYVNRAVSGQTTTQMLARVNEDVLSLRPHIVIVQNGTNEIGEGFEAIKETTQRLYMRVLGSGAKLVAMGIAARDANSSWSSENYATMAAINEFKRRFCEAHANCYYVDTNALVMNPTTGEALPNMLRDGIHWTPTGAFKAGEQLMQVLGDILPQTDVIPTYLSTPDDEGDFTYGNESPNPAFTGISGAKGDGVTGDVPDSWIIERIGTHNSTASATIAPKSDDDPRNEVSITFTPSAAAGTDAFFFRINPSVVVIQQPEAFYEGLMGIVAEAWDGFETISLEVDDSGPSNKTYYDGNNIYNLPMPNAAWSGIFRTPEFLPTGNLRLRVRVAIKGDAVGSGTLRFSTPVLRAIDPDTRLSFERNIPKG